MRVILKNVFSNWLGLFVHTAIAFILSPFLIHTLGKDIYGIWILVNAMTGYLGVLDFGVRSAVVKFTASYFAKKDYKNLSNIISNILTVFLIIAVISLLVVFILFFYIENIFNIDSSEIASFRIVFLLMGLNLALVFPLNIFGGMISGLQRYEITNLISIVQVIVKAILIFVLLSRGFGLLTLAIITVILDQLKHIIFYIIIKKLTPDLRITWLKYEKSIVKDVLKFSIKSFIIVASNMVVYYSGTFLIGVFSVLANVTYYTVSWNLIDYLQKVIRRIAFVLTPAASESEALGKEDYLKTMYLYSTKYTLMIMVPAISILLILGDSFLVLWLGPDFQRSYLVLIILTIAGIFALMQLIADNILVGLNKHHFIARMKIFEALANVLFISILVNIYGIYGAALGVAIPAIFINSFFLVPFSLRTFKITLAEFFREVISTPLMALIISLSILYSIDNILSINTWLIFILVCTVYCLLFMFIIYFALPLELRNKIVAFVSTKGKYLLNRS